MKKAITIITVLVLVIMGLQHYTPEGVVVMDDYPHAVVICGDELDGERLEQEGEFLMFTHRGNTVTVDWGHDNDPQLFTLLNKATTVCAQYN